MHASKPAFPGRHSEFPRQFDWSCHIAPRVSIRDDHGNPWPGEGASANRPIRLRVRAVAKAIEEVDLNMELAPDIHFAPIGAQSVVMDLARDRYFAIGPRVTEIVRKVTANVRVPSADCAADEPLDILKRTGAVGDEIRWNIDPGPMSMCSPPCGSIVPTPSLGLGISTAPRLTANILLQLVRAERSLKRRPFAETVRVWRRRKAISSFGRVRSRTPCLLDAYFAARPWFPVAPICRLDALALSSFLWSQGHRVDLVFGVRLEPFVAHCWVQHEGIALNEPFERLKQLTLIMSI